MIAALGCVACFVLCYLLCVKRERSWRRGAVAFLDVTVALWLPAGIGSLIYDATGWVGLALWLPVCFASGWLTTGALGSLNFCVLQWLGCRLERVRLVAVALDEGGAVHTLDDTWTWQLRNAWPLTGWRRRPT